jgi:hypothetical protein
MKVILLASLFLLYSATSSASDGSWKDVWGSIKNTGVSIINKTETIASNTINIVSESTSNTVETIKSSKLDFTVTADSAETSNLKETVAGPWNSVKGLFSSEWQRIIKSHLSSKRVEEPLI